MDGNRPIKLTGTSLVQFPVNIDIATTVHKLQGMTKENLVIADFNYKEPNWIYVVLSRLTSIKGLFLLKPLQKKNGIGPTDELINETIRMETLEIETLSGLQATGYYPSDIDLLENTVKQKIEQAKASKDINNDEGKSVHTKIQKQGRKLARGYNCSSTDHLQKKPKHDGTVFNIDSWFQKHHMKRLTGDKFLYEVGT